ncbi:hypothetical protein Bp8pS_186 [Bacillus phage vB_BpuM-BpSp]|nr:hypothetical protein Bp8pS_186 [Bacillus phage vB_BpuM-BpSp]
MLSSTYILRHIEKRLGYKFNELEIDPKEMMDSIEKETLITFSKYYPLRESTIINQDSKINGTLNKFYIATDFEILNINRAYVDGTSYIGGELAGYSPDMGDPFARQMGADMISYNKNPLLFHFEHPNIITIMPALYNIRGVRVDFNCVHPVHFGTIPTNLQDEFLKLALLDIKDVLYNLRHRFANMQTAFGSIELFIDDLQDASDRREELLAKWRSNFGKSANRKKIYIY